MTTFKTSTHRSLLSLSLRDRHGCPEVPPPADTDWVPEWPAEPAATDHDDSDEPGPEVWYG